MKLDTNFIKISVIFVSLFLFSVPLMGQGTVIVNEILSPDNIVIFYVGDFDFNDAKGSPRIFEYELSATQFPQTVKITFAMNATVPSLGLNNTELLFAETDEFTFLAPIRISNRQMDRNTDEIRDINNDPVIFGVPTVKDIGDVDPDLKDKLIKDVTESGKLPAGTYVFTFLVESSTASSVNNPFEIKIMEISNPTTLDLVSPGSYLEDEVEVFTLFPIFQWESTGCEYFIRVSEYDAAVHSSVEEALNDVSNLPFPDDGGYYGGDDGEGLQSTSLQYPLSGAKLLEFGKTYVWSVKKVCVTTAGDEERNSDIFAFKIPNISGEDEDTDGTGGVITDPVISSLQTLLGDVFDALFTGDGELAGYTEVANILLNGETATAEVLRELAERYLSGEVTAIQFEIQ
ncbi:MAG: hypothetical protein IH880_07550 [Candidatus Marinimicrobia bacterium]|nr:hypothetical protein [Candidatus Neomarinimicrobiota bacterium]